MVLPMVITMVITTMRVGAPCGSSSASSGPLRPLAARVRTTFDRRIRRARRHRRCRRHNKMLFLMSLPRGCRKSECQGLFVVLSPSARGPRGPRSPPPSARVWTDFDRFRRPAAPLQSPSTDHHRCRRSRRHRRRQCWPLDDGLRPNWLSCPHFAQTGPRAWRTPPPTTQKHANF